MINLTQWPASAQQISEGVVEPSSEDKAEIKGLLNFPSMPTRDEIDDRASRIAEIAERYGEDSAMIGGAPFLITPLENALSERGVVPMHAYTERISTEVTKPDGTVEKVSTMDLKGFVSNDDIRIERSTPTVVPVENEGKILNLTQHNASPQQVAAGVVEPQDKESVRDIITFKEMPDGETLKEKAVALANVAKSEGYDRVMIGGAPYFNSVVETACKAVGVQPVYAYTAPPVSKVVNNPDGSVTTTKVFEFKGFIEAVPNDPIDVDKDDVDKNEDNNIDNENSENMFDVDESEQITEDGVDDENIDGDDYDDFDDDDYDDFDDDDYDDFDDDDYDDFDDDDCDDFDSGDEE